MSSSPPSPRTRVPATPSPSPHQPRAPPLADPATQVPSGWAPGAVPSSSSCSCLRRPQGLPLSRGRTAPPDRGELRGAQPPLPQNSPLPGFLAAPEACRLRPLYLWPRPVASLWLQLSRPHPLALRPGTGCPQGLAGTCTSTPAGRAGHWQGLASGAGQAGGVRGGEQTGFLFLQEVHLPVAGGGGSWSPRWRLGPPRSLGVRGACAHVTGGSPPSRSCVVAADGAPTCVSVQGTVPPERDDQDEPQKSPCACTSFSQRV